MRGRSHLAQEVYLSLSTLFQDVQRAISGSPSAHVRDAWSELVVCVLLSGCMSWALWSKILFLWSRLPEPWPKLTSPWLCAWTAAAHCPAGFLHQHQQWGGVHSRDQRAMCEYGWGCILSNVWVWVGVHLGVCQTKVKLGRLSVGMVQS